MLQNVEFIYNRENQKTAKSKHIESKTRERTKVTLRKNFLEE